MPKEHPEKEGFDWDIKQIKMKIGWIEELRKKAPKEAQIDDFLKEQYDQCMAHLAKKKLEYRQIFGQDYQI